MTSNHFAKIAEIAKTIDHLNLIIFKHDYYYTAYGSWSLEIGDKKRRIQFSWDGRDSARAIGIAELKGSSDYLNWKPEYNPFDTWDILEGISDAYDSVTAIAKYLASTAPNY